VWARKSFGELDGDFPRVLLLQRWSNANRRCRRRGQGIAKTDVWVRFHLKLLTACGIHDMLGRREAADDAVPATQRRVSECTCRTDPVHLAVWFGLEAEVL
jgi:hypothetical protein